MEQSDMRRELLHFLDHDAETSGFEIDGATRVSGLFLPMPDSPAIDLRRRGAADRLSGEALASRRPRGA